MAVPQTDTGGLDEYSKASGRRRFKELGKLAGRNLGRCPIRRHVGSQRKIACRLFI